MQIANWSVISHGGRIIDDIIHMNTYIRVSQSDTHAAYTMDIVDIHVHATVYHTIRYDSEYLTCSKKPTGSQLSLPHGTNKKLKCETKNKMMSVIGPVQSRYREAVQ